MRLEIISKEECDFLYTLLLRLNAPLQTWGSESLYDNRNTDYYPTKSGVIGMIAAALGLQRGASLEELNSVQFGIRIDCQGEYVTDFQITDMIDENGKHFNKNLSKRMYLSDATFLVGLASANQELLERIRNAVHNPKFAMFLGRKSCPPTIPLDMGISESDLYTALYSYSWLVPEWRQKYLFGWRDKMELRIVVEAQEGALKKDVPCSFEANDRRYGYRNIKDMPGKIVYKSIQENETDHDPMKELG